MEQLIISLQKILGFSKLGFPTDNIGDEIIGDNLAKISYRLSAINLDR